MEQLDMSLDEIAAQKRQQQQQGGAGLNVRAQPYNNAGRAGGVAAGPSNRVFVGNLAWSVAWQDLKDHVNNLIGIRPKVDIMEKGGRSQGCAILTFDSQADAKRAMQELHDTELHGRLMFVREDREQARPPFQGGGQGGGQVGGQVGGSRGGFGNGAYAGTYDQPIFSGNSNLAAKIRNNAGGECCVYVGNLPWSASWQDLKDMAGKFGSVARADVEEYPDRKSKGFGIVVFDSPNDAQTFISQMNGANFQGRDLAVRLDTKPAGGGGGNRGGYRNGPTRSYGGGYGGARGGAQMGGHMGGGADSKIVVENLPQGTSWQELKDACRQYGDVIRVEVNAQGMGTVLFASPRGASAAIQGFSRTKMGNNRLSVRYFM